MVLLKHCVFIWGIVLEHVFAFEKIYNLLLLRNALLLCACFVCNRHLIGYSKHLFNLRRIGRSLVCRKFIGIMWAESAACNYKYNSYGCNRYRFFHCNTRKHIASEWNRFFLCFFEQAVAQYDYSRKHCKYQHCGYYNTFHKNNAYVKAYFEVHKYKGKQSRYCCKRAAAYRV